MKNSRSSSGNFSERPFFKDSEIEKICGQALASVGLMPDSPEPVRIERFIEKKFGVTPEYPDLPEGILGYSEFGTNGVEAVRIAHALEMDDPTTRRRLNSTLAHEAGHCLLHAYLFAFEQANLSLFQNDQDVTASKVLCRDETATSGQGKFDGRWWELQANKAIGPLLMPRKLAVIAANEFLTSSPLGLQSLEASNREPAAKSLASIFDVNPIVAKIRLESLFPQTAAQLTL
jgi:hypothetical protein